MSETETNQAESSRPQEIVQQAVVKGSVLGGLLLVFFAIGAVLVYLLTGLVGWDDNLSIRILVAMCIGPLLALVGFGGWILVQRGNSTNG